MLRALLLPAIVLAAASGNVQAAEVCDLPPRYGLSPTALNITRAACNEHRLWRRAFIDRDGKVGSLDITEAENESLADDGVIAWQRVAGYWRESGTLSALGDQPGASSCQAPAGTRYTDADCRAFLVDNPWSAAFVSWVMTRAGVTDFARSPRHIDYIRAASTGIRPYRLADPATEKPDPGDLLCFLRGRSAALSHTGLQQALSSSGAIHWKSHCEVVVAANVGGDRTLYLIGGNVLNTVVMRSLPLDRSGRIELPPPAADDNTPPEQRCTPSQAQHCSFNRQDWAALLKLNVATTP